MFWRTNYLEGAETFDGYRMTELIFDILGSPAACPNGAVFTFQHVESLMPDRGVNIPTMRMQDKFVYKYEKTARWYKWTADVGDCDTQTQMFGSDMSVGCLKNGFTQGMGFLDLSYISESRTPAGSTSKWAGYHSAPMIPYRDADTGLYRFRIKQPESLNYPGAWQLASREIIRWTIAEGIS